MSEQEREAIADAADMIVNNYAFTKDGGNIRVLNLRTESAALLLPDGRVSETSMEDIEGLFDWKIVRIVRLEDCSIEGLFD